MSPETARFLLDLVNMQQVNIGADDFDEAIAKVLAARAELRAIIGPDVRTAATTPAPPRKNVPARAKRKR